MIRIPQCFFCRRFPTGRGRVCDAYPDGIPLEIFRNEVDHTKPYKGDHGLTFWDVVDEETSGKKEHAPSLDVQYTDNEDARSLRAAKAEEP